MKTSKYRVFCPRCGEQYEIREFQDVMRRTIDKPCQTCRRCGRTLPA